MRRGFNVIDVMIVVVAIALMVAIVYPVFERQKAVLPSDEQNEVSRQALVEHLGPEWADAKPGDLIELDDGVIYVIQDIIYSTEIRFHSGLSGFSFTRLDIRRHLPQRKPVLFKESDVDFEKAMRRFVRQIAGLPKEKEESQDESVSPATDN